MYRLKRAQKEAEAAQLRLTQTVRASIYKRQCLQRLTQFSNQSRECRDEAEAREAEVITLMELLAEHKMCVALTNAF